MEKGGRKNKQKSIFTITKRRKTKTETEKHNCKDNNIKVNHKTSKKISNISTTMTMAMMVFSRRWEAQHSHYY